MTSFFLLLLASLAPLSSFASNVAPVPIQVLEAKGSAWSISSVDAGVKTELKEGSVISPGSKIVTDQDGSLKLRLAGGAAVWVKPGTSVELDQVEKKDWLLKLQDGALHASVSNPAKRPGFFRIRTRTATMGVRGTTFFVKTSKNEPDFLCTCKGTVRVADEKGKGGVDFTTKAHEKPQLIRAGDGAIDSRLSPIQAPFPAGTEHNDADVANLEALAR